MYILVDSIKETKLEKRFVSLTKYCNKEYLHFKFYTFFHIVYIPSIFHS